MYIGTTLNKDITTHQSYKMKKTLFLLLSLLVAGQVWAESRAEKLRDNLLHNPKYVTVVAHRGDWRSAPENSLQAFQNCIDMGVDMIELDLQRTSDGVLVVMHDRTLDRCSNGKGKISDHTYAELQQLYLKPQHAASITRHKIPTLEEALLLCKDKIMVNIDKGYDYFQEVYEIMERTGTTQQVIIKSGHAPEKVLRENADVVKNTIYMPIVQVDAPNAREVIEANLALHPVAIECCLKTYNADVEARFRQIRDAGVKVWINSIWGSLCAYHDDDRAVEMNEPDEAWGWILDRGATLIQSDRPGPLIQYLKKHKKHKLK